MAHKFVLWTAGFALVTGNAWGQTAGRSFPVPFVECSAIQAIFITRAEQAWGKTVSDMLIAIIEEDKKSYANPNTRPGPENLIDHIKSGLEKLANIRPSSNSRTEIQSQMSRDLMMLCWLDHYAGRSHSFGEQARLAHIPELQAKAREKQAADEALERAKPDDPKTTGRGARGE